MMNADSRSTALFLLRRHNQQQQQPKSSPAVMCERYVVLAMFTTNVDSSVTE